MNIVMYEYTIECYKCKHLVISQQHIIMDFSEHVRFIHFLDALNFAQNKTSVTLLQTVLNSYGCFSALV